MGLLSMALLSSAVLAAPSAGPGSTGTEGGDVEPAKEGDFSVYFSLGQGAVFETELLSLELRVNGGASGFPLTPGQPTEAPATFDVFFDVTYGGKVEMGTFRVDSFFDVFVDFVPSDPATGAGGMIMASLSSMLDLGSFMAAGVDIAPCIIVEASFELHDDPATGQTLFMTRSFSHVLLTVMDLRMPEPLVDFGSMTEEMSSFMTSKAGTTAQADSFFDVFTEAARDPGTSGGGVMSRSFFDISFAVFEPNDEPLLQLDADGRVQTGANLRPGQGDAMLHAKNQQSQRVDVMFNPKEYTLSRNNQWNVNEPISDGTSDVPGTSSFDVFFKVQPQPEPPRPPVSHIDHPFFFAVAFRFDLSHFGPITITLEESVGPVSIP